ncbi:MAG: DcrB-related protein [Pyrinomonadaceae bacterium]|nr:DcrB-related protein [Pyrinomonadaceae bacterium]
MEFNSNGWKTVLPEGWEDRSMITLVGATGNSGFASNIVVTRQRVEAKTSIEDYAQTQKEATMREIPNLQILDERPTTVNGAPAFQRLQRFQAEQFAIQQAQTFILFNQTVFIITGTATIEDFNAAVPAFRQFTASFEFQN